MSSGNACVCFSGILLDNSTAPPSFNVERREALLRMLSITFDRFDGLIVFVALKAYLAFDLLVSCSRFLASRFFRFNYLAVNYTSSHETSSLNLCLTRWPRVSVFRLDYTLASDF